MKNRFLIFMLSLLGILVFSPCNIKADEDCWAYEEYGEHEWDDNYVDYESNDASSHYIVYHCLYCDETDYSQEPHNLKYSKTIKYATPKRTGTLQYKCKDCGYVCTKKITWSYSKAYKGTPGYASYDIKSHSEVYSNSKSLTVKTYSYDKGYTIKVKIGKKTYSKKMNTKTNKYKFNIKKPACGSKITIKVYYKGKCVGKCDHYDVDDDEDYTEDYDYVWYAKKVKIGMTKNQVRWTWGKPSRTSSASGGWTYWYWDDGSHVYFKKGKVKYWYDAAQ